PRNDLAQVIGFPNDRFDLERYLAPSPKRHTLWRMLQNLEVDYARVGQGHKAAETASYRRMLEVEME
ncbi:MAG TPA: hypothetical protein VGX78_19010, partial [Pirellulales bacterium]|nr:hypothetical protein [Pirellulales bacterium]